MCAESGRELRKLKVVTERMDVAGQLNAYKKTCDKLDDTFQGIWTVLLCVVCIFFNTCISAAAIEKWEAYKRPSQTPTEWD